MIIIIQNKKNYKLKKTNNLNNTIPQLKLSKIFLTNKIFIKKIPKNL